MKSPKCTKIQLRQLSVNEPASKNANNNLKFKTEMKHLTKISTETSGI